MGYTILIPTAVDEALGIASDLQLSPNLATGYVDVQLRAARAGATDVQLYNAVGQTVYQGHFTGVNTQVPLRDLAAGIYTLRLSSGKDVWVRQVVKQ